MPVPLAVAARRRPRVQVVAIAVAGTLQCHFELLLHAGPQCAVINGTAIVPALPMTSPNDIATSQTLLLVSQQPLRLVGTPVASWAVV